MEYFFTMEQDLPAGVGFALWGREHIAWLCIAAAIGVLLCCAYRRCGGAGRKRLRIAVGCAVLACEVLKDLNLIAQGSFNVYYLPLHLCGLAVFFTFAHALRPGETIGNFVYSTCAPGALFALLFPDWTAYPAFSYHSVVAFVVHALLAAYPLMLLCGGSLRPRPRYLPRCFAILAALAAPIYVFDRVFCTNYMFLLEPSPGSPLEWFAAFLGNPGYLLGYLPMLVVIWGLLYLPFYRKQQKTA